jgi:hypothetical protein
LALNSAFDRATHLAHDRVDAGVEHAGQQLDGRRLDPGAAERQHPRARAAIAARTNAVGCGAPSVTAWLRIRLRWNASRRPGGQGMACEAN